MKTTFLFPFLALCAYPILSPSRASADTTIPGGMIVNQTWTAAGSPYRVQGDVTVPAGAFLVVEAGAVVEMESTDALGGGADTGRVEIIVQGQLRALGTSASPVRFRARSGTSGAWYGIVATPSATEARIAFGEIQHAQYGVRSDAPGTVLSVSDTTVSACSSYGLYVLGGTPVLDHITATTSQYGIYVASGGGATIRDAIVTSNTSRGIYVAQNSASTADTTILRATVHGNSSYGIYVSTSGSPRTVTVRDSIVTSNGTYGIYRPTTGSIVDVTYTNVWGHSTDYSGVSAGAGTLSANPLYVAAPTNLRITSNSPARFASSTMGDIGALPYAGDATGQLVGTLWTSTRVSTSTSVPGDLTVARGVTLTVDPGVTLTFATSDSMASGSDTARAELRVDGTLVAAGTSSSPVSFTSTSTTAGSWYGIHLLAGSSGTIIDYADVRAAQYGLWYEATAPHTIQRSTFRSSASYGVYVTGGLPTLDTITSTANQYGIYVASGGGATIRDAVVYSNTSRGIYVAQNSSSVADTIVVRATVHGNTSYGIYLSTSGSLRTVTIRDSIVTNNGTYGIYRPTTGSAVDVTYTNVWGHSTDYSGVSAGTGTFSGNPLYVAAPTNLRITSNSPARFASSTMGDIGALPYAGDATGQLVGTLWTSTRVSTSTSVPGDLTVARGVTLTVDPGVTLTFATSDLMASGSDTARAELRIDGTLTAIGTSASPVTFTSSSGTAGSWFGIAILPGSTDTVLDRAEVIAAQSGVRYEATAPHTFRRSIFRSSSSYGVHVVAGALTLDAITTTGNQYGIYVASGGAATITNAVVSSNTSRGIYVAQNSSTTADTDIGSSTVHGNTSYGIYLSTSGSTRAVRIRNSLVTSNGTYGIYRPTTGSIVEVTYSDVWGHSTDYSGVSAGTGAISANPLYVAAPGNLHLTMTSLAIDAGTSVSAPDHDRDFVARPVDGNGIGGAQFDLGAYEFLLMATCGNGARETGEACDDGANNGMYGYCNATCSGLGPRCGDALVNGPEECDDANGVDTDGCRNTCTLARCGDGVVRAGVEACDDGNTSNTDACTTTCAAARCGDGYVQAGAEACDDGNTSNTDACLSTCVAATCGDSYVRSGAEECDDGNAIDTDACLTTCVAARCGDGIVRAGAEACDDGNTADTDACLTTCVAARCGDGIVRAGAEACDDGNADETDACLGTCVAAACGDGFVWAGRETCDDGNRSDTDACVATCADARCGDGFVWAGVEGCDDGNTIDDDACPSTCELPSCGDAIRQPDEACDDGNDSNEDACLVGCAAASCGDGYTWSGEEACDDGNTAEGDGCDAMCDVETPVPDGGTAEDAGAGDGGSGEEDAGGETADGGGPTTTDAGMTPRERERAGCGCVAPGARDASTGTGAHLIGAVAAAILLAARRRRRPR